MQFVRRKSLEMQSGFVKSFTLTNVKNRMKYLNSKNDGEENY